ncbi:MAG: 4-diphosphocytidyl-2-C-methyl-D-erythritol kinase [Elusimicrobia bacterium ADurb.Bin231]|nr:MAG: 4-diphosphocytidyl-2-C-methyl-D-erythritol kinase [Elusimicrobia bacterium ADurb.Bin231]
MKNRSELVLKANAKINLFLDVINKRSDGYHDIKTVFQEVTLSDDIRLRQTAHGIKILCDEPGIPSDNKNLAYKAADLVKKYAGINKGISIKITKRIPAGAGLGGGSSDAAAVIKGLNEMWKLGLSRKIMCSIASEIGADVPFFIFGGRCLGEGLGEALTQIPVTKRYWYVVVFPGFEISTKYVYDQLTINKKKCIIKNYNKTYYNRLEEVVLPAYPEIDCIKQRLVAAGAEFSMMTGSGSSVFGVAGTETKGKDIILKMKKFGYKMWLVRSA